jgi:hypothetical protein
MNIRKYAPAVLLSSKINVYKGNTATNILMVRRAMRRLSHHCFGFSIFFKSILKNYRFDFDIPSGIENIPADWAKLVAEAQEALTQRRSTIKKTVSVHCLIPLFVF